MPDVISENSLQQIDKNPDLYLKYTSRLIGTHANSLPFISASQSSRTFYGARFVNQAMPLVYREEPLIQSINPETGRSFEEEYGPKLGAKFFNDDDEGEVLEVTPDFIKVKKRDGSAVDIDLYNNFPFNRKSAITNYAKVKPGDKVKKGDLLAASNYSSDKGNMAMGMNAYVAVVPYKGYSMDDAIVVSEGFASRLKSEHSYEHELQKDKSLKLGKKSFQSLFPQKFTTDQLDNLDEDGIAKPGTVLHKGDPMILASRPRTVSSGAHLGKLSKVLGQTRTDASQVWEHDYPGTVIHSANTKKKLKVFTRGEAPTENGDKIVVRNGSKSIVSLILPDDQMPRDTEGKPFDVLLNPLAIPSRVNPATIYEILLGKAAKKDGVPMKIPGYLKKGESWNTFVANELTKRGLKDVEDVYDPIDNKFLENPVTTGYAHFLKLHHVVDSKISARGNASYNSDQQPQKGGSEGAQAKRMGGLETTALLAAGAYNVIREGSILRGSQNDEYWKQVRNGYQPSEPGVPFVFNKFKALLRGAGMSVQDRGNGKARLAPFRDKDLDLENPIEIKNNKIVNLNTLEPVKGGLFDPALVASDRYGKISLNTPLPNPAFEKQVQQLLGITNAQLRAVIAGDMPLEEAQGKK